MRRGYVRKKPQLSEISVLRNERATARSLKGTRLLLKYSSQTKRKESEEMISVQCIIASVEKKCNAVMTCIFISLFSHDNGVALRMAVSVGP